METSNPYVLALLGPAVGFLGVILTLLWTARKDRQARLEKDRDEAQALAAALLATVRSMQHILGGEIGYLEKPTTTWSRVSLIDYFEVFRVNLARIGQLTPAQASALTNLYFVYQERAGFLSHYAGTPGSIGGQISFDFTDGNKSKDVVLTHLKRLVPLVDAAAAALAT